MRNKARNSSIKLIGHAGPVYGTCFSENSEYLLSVSQDKIGIYNNLHYTRNNIYFNIQVVNVFE